MSTQEIPARSEIPPRSEVPKEERWNDTAVFASRKDWETAYADLRSRLGTISGYQGTLSEGPARLLEWLGILEDLHRKRDLLMFYAYMATAVDGTDSQANAMAGQAGALSADLASAGAFTDPELIAIGGETLAEWMDADPAFAPYRHYIENILRTAKHVRSAEVEAVLGTISEPFSTVEMTYSMATSLDLKFPPATSGQASMDVTQSNIEEIKKHPDREIRRSGMEGYADAYLGMQHTLASNYLASAKQALATARIRGFDTVLEYKLSPYNLPTDVFHNLIEIFTGKLPLWHRYWKAKAGLLKLDILKPHDIWAPLTDNQPSYSFRESVDMIVRGMEPLGEKYTSVLQKGCLEDGWVDYARNKGKSQGAFSYGTYDTAPCIMLSYDGSLAEMSTLAHELGHSMHSWLTHENQSYSDSGYSMFVAEVASNFNQAMVRDQLFAENDDRDFQLALIQEAMDNIHRYFFIMPTLARFEYEVYSRLERGEALNTEILLEIMAGLYREGYGDALDDDELRTSITWATFGHLYEPYYTFQYATGISAAHALCRRVLDGGKAAADDYLAFLSLGNHEYPLEALKRGGVDMLSSEPVEAGFAVLEKLVEKIEGFTAL